MIYNPPRSVEVGQIWVTHPESDNPFEKIIITEISNDLYPFKCKWIEGRPFSIEDWIDLDYLYDMILDEVSMVERLLKEYE
jgi:hypothetical protein